MRALLNNCYVKATRWGFIHNSIQPRSQGLYSSRPLEGERDPGNEVELDFLRTFQGLSEPCLTIGLNLSENIYSRQSSLLCLSITLQVRWSPIFAAVNHNYNDNQGALGKKKKQTNRIETHQSQPTRGTFLAG